MSIAVEGCEIVMCNRLVLLIFEVLSLVFGLSSLNFWLVLLVFKKQKTCTVVLFSYRNISGSLGEQEMLFRVLPNFHECFYDSIDTQRTCFLFLFRKHCDKRKENSLLFLIIKV